MQTRDPTAVLRATYALDRDEASWVRGIVEAARGYDFGLGVVGCVLEIGVEGARRRSLVVETTDTLDESMFDDVVNAPSTNGSTSRVARSVRARRPARYVWGVAGGSANTREWIVLFFPCKSHDDGWSARDLEALEEIGLHLGVALRLRRAAKLTTPDERVSSMRAAIDGAQAEAIVPPLRRAGAEEKRALWASLLEGKWAVIENVESAARRSIVACGSVSTAGDRRLSASDATVVRHVVLGHSLKIAASELGLSISGVAACLRRALHVLGVSSRAELIRWFRPWVAPSTRSLTIGGNDR